MNIKINISFFILLLVLISQDIFSQPDTVNYQWPVTPLNESHGISGTFCEFRNTLTSDHFHNAVDIPKADGSPVYPVLDGIIHTIDAGAGSNSYVRVRTNVSGKWKHITYLHIVPNPTLSVGQTVVKGTTVLGSIYSGMGHVHLTERELVSSSSSNGSPINNIRESGGLNPYVDEYSPVIHSNTLKFVVSGTNITLPSYGLASKVDIKIKIEEVNGTSSSYRNNGTYIAGYRIWNPDTSVIVFEQFPEGITYMFDRQPVNDDVHKVFVLGEATLSDPVYWLTNGNGADYINQNLRVNDNYFDTELIPEGDYILEVFTEDTRRNTVNSFFPITITRNDVAPPGRPTLLAILNIDSKKSVKVIWEKNEDPDILGYRLYYSVNTQLSTWSVAADETMLTKDINSFEITSPENFVEPTNNDIYFFYLTAVDSSGNESEKSDIYSRSSFVDGTSFPKALIVDGFDRYGGSGSWQNPIHSFNTNYFIPMTLTDSMVISSAANEAVTENYIDLSEYDLVVWFVGDESTVDNTFTSEEQGAAASYLESGGNLIVSGSEIGWDLDRSHSYSQATDTLFYRHYLKAQFVDDGNTSMTGASGITGTLFSGLVLNIGQVYPEDWPDDINPINGSSAILNYNANRSNGTKRIAGIAYTGIFRNTDIEGKVIYLSFPLETVYSLQQRVDFFTSALEYFGLITNVDDHAKYLYPGEFVLYQNYPNPFNPSTQIKVLLANKSLVRLEIFNSIGERVELFDEVLLVSGVHEFTWNAGQFASGVYFARINVYDNVTKNKYSRTISMILLK